MLKLAMMLILATALAGCITPQKLYKINAGRFAGASDAANKRCSVSTSTSGGHGFVR